MAFKVNKARTDLCSYPPYIIMGEDGKRKYEI